AQGELANKTIEGTAGGGVAAAATAGGAELSGLSAELRRLAARVERLESRPAAPADAGASGAAAPAAPPKAAPPPPKPMKTPAALQPFLASRESEPYRLALREWPAVLQRVKERKITVHAWLVDGEPVSATEDVVLVAFKNTFHRDTTEKPANKELIESAMAEVIGRPVRLATMLLKDWKAAEESAAGTSAPPEVLELTPEDDAEGEGGKKYKEDWINEAINVFGEGLVVVKE
ncbi:MAG TPA: DNA polymerase III subunit gamma/tau, partial [Paenibacillus sp.]|nr:DNA polymerase III subunit gamma/tau [Paenibacillus sp.]